jgi:hypothetical protein
MYIAAPKFERVGAVLVLHSWWGLNRFFRRLCDRLAGAKPFEGRADIQAPHLPWHRTLVLRG